MPGYPKTDKFETDEEVEAYFSGDKIQCLLCGKWYKELSLHLRRIHDVTPDDYREKYGIPWKQGLTGCISYNKRSDRATEYERDSRNSGQILVPNHF